MSCHYSLHTTLFEFFCTVSYFAVIVAAVSVVSTARKPIVCIFLAQNTLNNATLLLILHEYHIAGNFCVQSLDVLMISAHRHCSAIVVAFSASIKRTIDVSYNEY